MLIFFFFRPTTSKNEVDEQNLFVELFLRINTNKSYAIAPLRKQIQKGKLGKYTVGKSVDICEGMNNCFFFKFQTLIDRDHILPT